MTLETLKILAGPIAGTIVALGITVYARWIAKRDVQREQAKAKAHAKA